MTAEKLEQILQLLPHWHEQFLLDYRRAHDAADEVRRSRHVRDALHLWHLRAVAYSRPGFDERLQAARECRADEFTPAEQVVPGWPSWR